jgi:iron complex transport system substrate-binding protein
MKLVVTLNAGALGLALAASTCAVWLARPASRGAQAEGPDTPTPTSAPSKPLLDSGGTTIPLGDYRHIVSASPVADEILIEICEPDRVAAFSASSGRGPRGFRFSGKPTIERLDDLERILSLHPDLILAHGIGDPRPVARLREAGLVVFDLGEMRGLSTLVPEIHELARALGHPERGDRFARDILQEMRAVAADVPASDRPRAMHLSVYGDTLFGGALETSYHDVLTAAGLRDAASSYRGWPQYTAEQILTIDPDVIVTSIGMRQRLCERSGLTILRACNAPNHVVEIDGEILGNPGPSMVDAARLVRAAVHGQPAEPSSPTPHTL